MKFLSYVLLITTLFTQEIDITSTSKEAIHFYHIAWNAENKMDIEIAESNYKKAVLNDSTFALTYLRLAMLRDNFEQRRNYIRDAMKHLNAVSPSEKLLILAQDAVYGQGNDDNEFKYFKQLYELKSKSAEANFLYGFVHNHHGRSDTKKAIELFQKAISINPNYLKPYNYLIYAFMDDRQFNNGKEIAERYIKMFPNATEPLDSYADLLMRSGEYQLSLTQYNKLLERNPESMWALSGKAANLNYLNRHQEARHYINKINITHISDYQYRHRWKAELVSFLDEENIEGALETLEKQHQETLIGKNKRERIFHLYYSLYRRVRLLFEYGLETRANEEYKRWNIFVQSTITNPKTKERIKNLELFYQAYSYYLKSNFQKANEKIQAFTALLPKKNDAIKILEAKIAIAEGQFIKAKESVSSINLSNAYHQYYYAFVLIKNNNLTEAKRYLNKIRNKNDQNNIDLSIVRKKAIRLLNSLDE